MSIEAQLWEILRELERDIEKMLAAGLLPVPCPAEREAARQRMIADYALIERQIDRFTVDAVERGNFLDVAQLLDVGGQARILRENCERQSESES